MTSAGAARILVVEDESIVAMLIEDLLTDLGFIVIGPVSRVDRALALIESTPIDGALLDVNLDGETSYPIAQMLSQRGCPFVFVTGYGEAGVDPAFRDRPIMQKPFTGSMIERYVSAYILPSG